MSIKLVGVFVCVSFLVTLTLIDLLLVTGDGWIETSIMLNYMAMVNKRRRVAATDTNDDQVMVIEKMNIPQV